MFARSYSRALGDLTPKPNEFDRKAPCVSARDMHDSVKPLGQVRWGKLLVKITQKLLEHERGLANKVDLAPFSIKAYPTQLLESNASMLNVERRSLGDSRTLNLRLGRALSESKRAC